MFSTPFSFMAAPAGGGDADATAYLAAVVAAGGTVTPTITTATNTLFTDLKTAGLYSDIYAFWPYTGSVAASHSIEGKLQTAYYMTFGGGGWTHNANGATPNGTSSWGDTGFNASTNLTLNNSSIYSYFGTDPGNVSLYGMDFGTTDVAYNTNTFGWLIGGNANADKTSYFYAYGGGNGRVTVDPPIISSGLGGFLLNRVNSTLLNIWQNGTKVATSTLLQPGSLPSLYSIGAPLNPVNFPGSLVYGKKRHQFDVIALGLSDVKATALFTIVNAFQTALGRNVY
jgi:hypothetical protein